MGTMAERHHPAAKTHTSRDGVRRTRRANYIADVLFIALLAAPFLIFESPASVQDAVVAAGSDRVTVVAPAAAAPSPATTSRAPD
jgi:hypothetical protein